MIKTPPPSELIPKIAKLDESVTKVGGEVFRLAVANDELRKNLREMLLDFESGLELMCSRLGLQNGDCKECGICQFKSRIGARIKIIKQRTGLK